MWQKNDIVHGPIGSIAIPSSLASLTFLLPIYPGCPEKQAIKRVPFLLQSRVVKIARFF